MNKIPNPEKYELVENHNGIDIYCDGMYYSATVYDSVNQQSIELVKVNRIYLIDEIDFYMCKTYYTALKDLIQSLGVQPVGMLWDTEIQHKIKDKIVKEINYTIENL